MQIKYNAKDLYFQLSYFDISGNDPVGVYVLSSNTAMMCRAFLLHYGKWRNRYTYDLNNISKPQLSQADYNTICDIVDWGIFELAQDSFPILESIAHSLHELQITHKKQYALQSNNKVIKWTQDAPLKPVLPDTNSQMTLLDTSLWEWLAPSGVRLGIGDMVGKALLNDGSGAVISNNIAVTSKLDTIDRIATKLTELASKIEQQGNEDTTNYLEELRNVSEALQGVSSAAQSVTAIAQSVTALAEVGELAKDTAMGIEESIDDAVQGVAELSQVVTSSVNAIASLGTALGTWVGAASQFGGLMLVANSVLGVGNQLERLNQNIGGGANGDGYFDYIIWKVLGGDAPESYQPSIAEILSGMYQSSRESTARLGGSELLNVPSSLQYIGTGDGLAYLES